MATSQYPVLSPYQQITLVGNQRTLSVQISRFLHTDPTAVRYVERLHYDGLGVTALADMIVIDIDDLAGEELAQQIYLAHRLYHSRIPVVLASRLPVAPGDLQRYLACGVLDVIDLSRSNSRAMLNHTAAGQH
jgi:hypothetical protein